MPENQVAEAIRFLSVAAIPILFAITVHEVAHGWVARLFGDRTAEMLGRLTLNPIKHIDPVGTIIVPVLMLLFSNFLFGWAKPVPIGVRNLRNPKRDMVAVAVAGPAANLLMAFGWTLAHHLVAAFADSVGSRTLFFLQMARIGVFFNILLMIFNLLPIPPLDGGRVLRGLVPESVGYRLDALERYGIIIVIGLLVFVLWRPLLFVVVRLMGYLKVPLPSF